MLRAELQIYNVVNLNIIYYLLLLKLRELVSQEVQCSFRYFLTQSSSPQHVMVL